MKNTFKLGIILGLLIVCVGAVSALDPPGRYTIQDGVYIIVKWNVSQTTTWTVPAGVTFIDYLVVAGGGGGGGGGGGSGGSGGGGAGGMVYDTSYAVTPGTVHSIIVGAGGAGSPANTVPPVNGGNSNFSSVRAIGGGYGGAYGFTAPGYGGATSGGSGGGGGGFTANAAGTAGQGYAGGPGTGGASPYYGGGGGGAGGPGGDATSRLGGIGRASSITGSSILYAVGGNSSWGTPVIGNASSIDGTGKGGDSQGGPGVGLAGGLGVVIIRYLIPDITAFTSNATYGATPTPIQFSDISSFTPTSWDWTFTNVAGDNNPTTFSTTKNPVYSFGVGNFSIKLNASNSTYSNISPQATFINVTLDPPGRYTTYSGNNTVVKWNVSQTTTWTVPAGVTFIDYLVVAGGGGGGGGGGGSGGSGGGGAGGMVYDTSYAVTPGTVHSIIVGAGGAGSPANTVPPVNGGNSNFSSVRALGGGYGGAYGFTAPGYGGATSGGSGGGGGGFTANAAGTAGQGYAGGPGTGGASPYYGGGGGGAGGPGGDATSRLGGIGRASSITGSSILYAIGGNSSWGTPVIGNASSVDGTGKGGDSQGGPGVGLAGGSGVVIIRFLTPVLPVANFTSNITTVVQSLPVQFNDTSTGSPISWNWSFGDGMYSSMQNPVHAYTPIGIYTVALNATNSYGSNTTTKINYINVILPVAASFSTNTTSGADPITVQFNDTSTGSPTAWNWSFRNVTPGNNTQVWFSTAHNPAYTFGVGNYSIVLNASNSVGYNLSNQVTFINVTEPALPPVASFTGIPTTGDVPLTVQFNDTSTGFPSVWNWSFGDGVWFNTTVASQKNATHTYSAAGPYTVNLTVSNNAGKDSELKANYIRAITLFPIVEDEIAIFRSSTGYWYFDYNLDGIVDKSFRYGGVGDQIIKGDWRGAVIEGIAIFRPSTGYWYFDYYLDGVVDKSFRYGGVGDRIIVGRWNGTYQDGIAIFRPSTGYWYFDYNLDGIVDKSFRYGGVGDQIIKGDWQGTGKDGIAIFRPSTGYWYFDYNLDGVVDKFFRYGGNTDRIIVGKWNGTWHLQDGIAIFRPSTGYWYFDYNLDGLVDKSFRYGGSTDQIIKGRWQDPYGGQGIYDGIAIFRPSTGYWYFDYNLDGIVDKAFRYGGNSDQIIAGKWV